MIRRTDVLSDGPVEDRLPGGDGTVEQRAQEARGDVDVGIRVPNPKRCEVRMSEVDALAELDSAGAIPRCQAELARLVLHGDVLVREEHGDVAGA